MKCTVYHDVRVSDVGSSKYDAGKKGIDASLSLTFIDIPILEKESWQNKLQQETNLIGGILVGLAYIFLSLFPRFFAE